MDTRITVRLDEDTATTLQRHCETLKLSASGVVRVALHELVTRSSKPQHSDAVAMMRAAVDVDQIKWLSNEISRLGNNVNQIARKANMGLIEDQDREMCEAFLRSVRSLLMTLEGSKAVKGYKKRV